MAAQALYRRWRPQSFEEVYGQEHITRTLRNAVGSERLAHAYLFTGLRGTGKTSVARILAKAVNCVGAQQEGVDAPCNDCALCHSITEGRSLDLIEIDAASNTGVDDVRELREKIGFAPNEARYKVYIIDEVHMLSTAAFNALLKTLEEPPAHALFILATTEPHKIPETILSRCQRHDFRRIGVPEVAAKLAKICETEGVPAEPAALERIARAGTGSLRDAESLLDQVIATGDGVTLEHVRIVLGTPGGERVAALVAAVIEHDAATALRELGQAIDGGADPEQMRSRLLEHLRGLLLLQTGADDRLLDVPGPLLETMRDQAGALPTSHLVATIHRVNDARPSPDRSQPTLPLELALVEAILDASDGPVRALPAEGASATSTRTAEAAPPTRQRPAQQRPAQQPAVAPQPKPEPAAPPTQQPHVEAPAVAEPPKVEPPVVDQAQPVPTQPATSKQSESAAAAQTPAPPLSTPSPAPATSSAAAPAATPGAAFADLSALQARWSDVVATVAGLDRNTAALLKDCRPVAVEGQEVVLGFFYEFHCKRAGEGARQAAITRAVADVLGVTPTLRLTVVPQSEGDRKGRPRSKTERAGTDPVVRHALDELGGRIAGVRGDPDKSG
jgi:DNA polymerase-3 subunit gamma/tau